MILPLYCPECHAHSIERHPRAQSARCPVCDYSGHVTLFLKEKPHKKAKVTKRRNSGSGQFAGKITIPGYRYGGTRLG